MLQECVPQSMVRRRHREQKQRSSEILAHKHPTLVSVSTLASEGREREKKIPTGFLLQIEPCFKHDTPYYC